MAAILETSKDRPIKQRFRLRWLGVKGHPVGSHIQTEIPDELKHFTVDELRAYAEKNYIDVGDERNKSNLLKQLGKEVTYMAGQEVLSEEDLEARWPEKFERVHEQANFGVPMSYEEALAKGIITPMQSQKMSADLLSKDQPQMDKTLETKPPEKNRSR